MRFAVVVLVALVGAGPARPAIKEPIPTVVARQQVVIERLEKRVEDLEQKLAAMERRLAEVEPKVPDSVAKAVAEKRLAVGMTLAQANKAMGREGKLIDETDKGVQQYSWEFYHQPDYTPYADVRPPDRVWDHTVTAIFRDGKIVSHARR